MTEATRPYPPVRITPPSAPETVQPVGNVSVTAACGVCGRRVPAGRARRWCSDACRQAAFRIRRAAPAPTQPAKVDTVYECPECEARYLGEQRCEACNRWCRRLGPGGPCPRCDGLVVLCDFLRPDQLAGPARQRSRTQRGRQRS
jgi:hypothetical protein